MWLLCGFISMFDLGDHIADRSLLLLWGRWGMNCRHSSPLLLSLLVLCPVLVLVCFVLFCFCLFLLLFSFSFFFFFFFFFFFLLLALLCPDAGPMFQTRVQKKTTGSVTVYNTYRGCELNCQTGRIEDRHTVCCDSSLCNGNYDRNSFDRAPFITSGGDYIPCQATFVLLLFVTVLSVVMCR